MGAFDEYPLTQDPAAVAAAPPRAAASPFDDIAPLQMAPAAGPRVASGLVESVQAGLQGSVAGHAWRRKVPDLILDPETSKWWERLATGVVQLGADLPIMIPAGVAGAAGGAAAGTAVAPGLGTAVGGVVGGGAAMFAAPALIRESLVQSFRSSEINTAADWFNAVREVATHTAKEGAIGAVTMGAGGIAARTVGKAIAPSIGTALSVPAATKAIGASDVAAQIAAMVTMPAALQGRLPDAMEFVDAAAVILTLKAGHMAYDRAKTAKAAEQVADTYVKTGRTPAEQVMDAQAGVVKPEDYAADAPRETSPAVEPRAREAAAARLAELGTKAETAPLTDAERAERVFLANAKPDALAKHFDLTVEKSTRAEIDASADRVREDVLRQLREVDDARKATGQTPLGDDHAQAVATLQARQVSYIAKQMGVLPEEIYKERALKIRDEAQAEAEAAKPPEGAQMFTPPETDLFGNPVEVTNAPRVAIENMATIEAPLDKLVLSKEVPQFKHAADDKGVIVPLGGKFDRTGVGPIQVWERLDGTMEVISGRHRLDLARRSGETTMPAQIHREADGFTANRAAALDAELNIREEQGSVADYVQHFQTSGTTKEAAELAGLLARAKGRAGFAIARDASPDLRAAHRAGLLSDDAALSISSAAPGSERLQALGIAMVNDGKSALMAVNTMKAVEMMAADRIAEGKQGDIFGFDDSAMLEAQAMAKKASSMQRKISEQISAVSGASRRPELARKMGVDVADPEGIQKKIALLKQEQFLWDNWPLHPELVARLRAPEITGREGELNQGPAPKKLTDLEYTIRYYSQMTWESEDAARAHMRRRIAENNEQYSMFGQPMDTNIVDQMTFKRAAGGRVRLRAPTEPRKQVKWSEEMPEDANAPDVDWSARDNQDKGTPESIKKEFGRERGKAYQAWVPIDELPASRGGDIKGGALTEESGARDDLGFRGSRAPPALKVRIGPRGKIDLMDGNHRLAYWREHGYDHVPAWVIDERPADKLPPNTLYQEPFDLKPETPAELKARDDEAAAAAKRKLAQEKTGVKELTMTKAQADLFNTQGSLFQPAFHGSPHDVDRFSTEKVGSGEGAAAYGWGLYFAENPAIATNYFKQLSGTPGPLRIKLGGLAMSQATGWDYNPRGNTNYENIRSSLAESLLINENALYALGERGFQKHVLAELDAKIKDYKTEWPEAVADAEKLRADLAKKGAVSIKFHKETGGVYQVDIPDEHVAKMLLWDKPMRDQPEAVKAELAKLFEVSTRKVSDKLTDVMVRFPGQNNPGSIGTYPRDRALELASNPMEVLDAVPLTGEAFYRALERAQGSGEQASNFLKVRGITGIKYLDAGSRQLNVTDQRLEDLLVKNKGDENAAVDEFMRSVYNTPKEKEKMRETMLDAIKRLRTHNLVVFDDSIINLTHKNGEPVTAKERGQYFQNEPQNQDVHRGSYDIAKNLIKTMQGSDKSTVVHELGHSWLEDFKLYAAKPNAPESLKNDWGILRRELGIGENGEISRASHEQWARTVERYLAEGEAPTPELAGVFSRFREWLLAIYSDLKNLNATVNPELKALLDKMLAGDRDIADAKELNVPPAYVEMARANEAAKIVPSEKPGFKDEQLAMEPFAEELLMGPGSGKGNDSRINAQFINGPLELKLAIQRVSEIDQEGIQKARGGVEGTKSWADANAEVDRLANDVMGGKMVLDATPAGMPAIPHDIQQRAAFRIAVAIAKHSLALRDNILAKGPDATVQEQFDYLSSIVRMRMAQAEYLGLRAASARALNQIKDMTAESGVIDRMVEMTGGDGRLFQGAKTDAEVAADLKIKLDKLMAEHFGGKSALDIAKLSKDIKSLKGQISLAKEVTDATVWDGVIEGWKAGLLSGPQTPITNIIGTWSFQALRAPIDAVSAIIGMARGASPGMGESDRASMSEALARITGSLGGIKDGLKLAYYELKRDEPTEKVEAYRTAIPGRAGELIRFPFRMMSAGDMLTTTMYKRGEMKTLAIRQAFDENLNPQTREFAERVQAIIDNPPPKLLAMAEEAANRMAFNQPGGEKIAATQTFVRNWKLEWMVPFIRTPANIAAEMLRMTPLAPIILDWRADIAKGGVARDKAIAEVVVGSGIMALTMAYAFDGTISGSGSPDPGKNRGKVGVWQPNSVLVGDTWYEIGRLQPGGTLMVLAADVANAWDHMTDEERDKIPKILAMAFANAITNQTFLQGITNVVHMMSEPDRYGQRFLQGLAGSAVPNIIGQPTAMADPYVRQVNSMLEAVQARIPGYRQLLEPKVDWLGEKVETKERMGAVLPVREQKVSTDKVRTEAARLDISMSDAPKKTHIGKGTGKLGDVELTPEERTKFAKVGGERAHNILTGIVNSPNWDTMPPLVQRKIFSKVLTASHQVAAVQALPMDKRIAYIQSISEKVAAALEPE